MISWLLHPKSGRGSKSLTCLLQDLYRDLASVGRQKYYDGTVLVWPHWVESLSDWINRQDRVQFNNELNLFPISLQDGQMVFVISDGRTTQNWHHSIVQLGFWKTQANRDGNQERGVNIHEETIL